jgi:hypothetical protein
MPRCDILPRTKQSRESDPPPARRLTAVERRQMVSKCFDEDQREINREMFARSRPDLMHSLQVREGVD